MSKVAPVCKCIPKKILNALNINSGELQQEMRCVTCNKKLENNDHPLAQVYVYGCHQVSGRVHCSTIFFCSDDDSKCTITFRQ